MNTITTYKVVYVDSYGDYGDIQEYDTQSETEARRIAERFPDSILYRIRILGEIERIT